MPVTAQSVLTVALIGNPNTGKSTLFSALAGTHQHVGNYPGVTVEKKTGRMAYAKQVYELLDLPGLYSLSPRSRDEMIAVDVLLGRQKETAPLDAVISIVDAANLVRNLYLVSQVRELGLPMVVAVNMLDVAAARSITLDLPRLERQLGVPVVGIQAHRRLGIAALKSALAVVVEQSAPGKKTLLLPPEIEPAIRYARVERMLDGVLTEPHHYSATATDRIDRFLTHRFWGLIFFAAVMLIVFQAVFTWAQPAMHVLESATALLGGWVEDHLAEGALRSLLVGGMIRGVGSVLAFLPQILILFFFLGILEDCGYLARAAFLMDQLMSRIGLSGKSVIPMLSSFACSVPGIMACRVIENDRQRLTTILVSPLLTCSARLPIYALLIAAFIPAQTCCGGLLSLQGLTLAGLYLLGILAAVTAASVLKKTLLRGRPQPFVLELPSYKWPSLRTVTLRMLERGRIFLRTAGTLILAVSLLVWAGLYYPHDPRTVAPLLQKRQQLQQQLVHFAENDPARTSAEKQLQQLAGAIDGTYQRHSILAALGHCLEPAVKPLGWDWRIGCAVIASLPAREVVVATLGVMYDEGDSAPAAGRNGHPLQQRMRSAVWEDAGGPVFNIPVALSIMVFFALCPQCVATLAVIRRETNSWRWPAFTFAYMTALAYLGALITYQAGMRLGG